MNHVIVKVYLPTLQRNFEVKIPYAMNSLLAANLTAKAIAPLSEMTYLPSHSSIFAWKETGILIATGKTIEEAGIINGSHLILL